MTDFITKCESCKQKRNKKRETSFALRDEKTRNCFSYQQALASSDDVLFG